MSLMNNQTLLPNPQDWLSIGGAATLLGVSDATVYRMVSTGILTGYRADNGRGPYKAPVMLWRAEVEGVRFARATLRPARARG